MTKERGPRVNQQIRISPVRIIDEDGEQLGIMEVHAARQIAEERGLDLVEVAPTARPPVCKIMDFGKYKYEQAKRDKEAKKKQHQVTVKEMKFRPKIDDHDYEFKVAHVREFLEKGDKAKLTIMFRGREMMHQEFGLAILERVRDDLSDISGWATGSTRIASASLGSNSSPRGSSFSTPCRSRYLRAGVRKVVSKSSLSTS